MNKFNFISNILFLVILLFGSLVWADSNGVWQFANDTRAGIFGGDEQIANMNYTFINPVFFQERVIITNSLSVDNIKSASNGNVVITLG